MGGLGRPPQQRQVELETHGATATSPEDGGKRRIVGLGCEGANEGPTDRCGSEADWATKLLGKGTAGEAVGIVEVVGLEMGCWRLQGQSMLSDRTVHKGGGGCP